MPDGEHPPEADACHRSSGRGDEHLRVLHGQPPCVTASRARADAVPGPRPVPTEHEQEHGHRHNDLTAVVTETGGLLERLSLYLARAGELAPACLFELGGDRVDGRHEEE